MKFIALVGSTAALGLLGMAAYQRWIPWWIVAGAALVASLVVCVLSLRRRRHKEDVRAWSLLPTKPADVRANDDVEAALAEHFELALRQLHGSRSARRRFGRIPWYLVIGAPGAGKSAALGASRVVTRLCGEGPEALRLAERSGVHFWVGRDALLVDCAGVHVADPAQREGWNALIAQLVRARPSRPLDGVLLAVSTEDLLADDASLDALADRTRCRLDELMTALDTPLPVHLMVTKADLQTGFSASFEGASESEREQVLGFKLARGTSCADGRTLSAQAERIVQVIERRALATLGTLSTVSARHAAFAYPGEVEALMARVTRFLRHTLSTEVHLESVLRGVYLTSARQEGRGEAQVSSADGRTTSPSRQQPYFLDALLGKAMAREHAGAAIPAHRTRRRARSLRAGVALVCVLCVLSSAGMVRAYCHNRALLGVVREELGAILDESKTASSGDMLRALEPVRARLVLLSSWQEGQRPLGYRFGLYQGDLIAVHLRKRYVDTLRTRFVVRLVAALEHALVHFPAPRAGDHPSPTSADYAKLYEQTRTYALLTYPKERGEPFIDQATVAPLRQILLSDEVSQLLPRDRALAARHLDTFLGLLARDPTSGPSRGPSVLAEARAALRHVSIAKLTIDRLVAQLDDARLEQTLTSLLGATDAPLSARSSVHGAFTRMAWEKHIKPIVDDPRGAPFEAWVLGADAARRSDACALREEYFARYVDAWRDFIGGLRIRTPRDHLDALLLLQDMTRGQPAPIERLLRAIGAQIDLAPAAESNPSEAAKQPGIFDELRGRFGVRTASASDACEAVGADVAVRRPLQGFLAFGSVDGASPTAGQLTAAQIYQEQLVYVRDALQSYLDDPSSADALVARLSTARTRVRSLIETQEIGWRPRFEALLWPAIDGASARAMAALHSAQSAAFCTAVTLPFERTLHGRYPFARDGQDAAIADVADFYRPNDGILWGYYQGALKRDVPAVGGRFLQRTDHAGRYAPELTRFLEQSARVTAVLFPPRAPAPLVGFELRVRPAAGVAQVTLVIDGTTVDFHNGPERWHALTWPGSSPRRGASMRVLGQGVDEQIVQEGEWGLFRLLERGTVSFDPQARFFTVRFRLRTLHDVVIDVRPARVDNPFFGAHGLLDAFRAPEVRAPRAIARGDKRRCIPSTQPGGRR